MKKLELQNRKGQKIVGTLTQPAEICGTCIIQHGYSGVKEQEHILAMQEVFVKHSFQTFNFDTTNSFGESDGAFEEARLGLHYEDFEDVVNWAQEQKWFVGPLAVTGHSMGGYAVARYAAENSEKVQYCLPIAPVVSGELSFEAYEESKPGGLKEWEQEGVRISVSKTTGNVKHSPWEQMQERLDHDLLPQADKLTMPVFLYVGAEDDSCTPKHIQKLFDAIPGDSKTMVVAEGAPNTYRTEHDLKHLSDSIDTWLDDVL